MHLIYKFQFIKLVSQNKPAQVLDVSENNPWGVKRIKNEDKKQYIIKIKLNQSIFGKWKFCDNKIIIKWVSMLKNSENANTRKKLEDYSYFLNHNIGKGYSSTVYKGRNDITGTQLT